MLARLLYCAWKTASSVLINSMIVKDVRNEHSVSIVNICEALFSWKLFNKSLQCAKNNFQSIAEKELANVERAEMPGPGSAL